MPVTEDYINELERRHGSSPELEELRKRYSSVPQIDIDPEVIAKRNTISVLEYGSGLDSNTINKSYNTIIKNIYGEELKPSAVQEKMIEEGFIINPEVEDNDLMTIATAIMNDEEPPRDIVEKRNLQDANRQMYRIFDYLRQEDRELFNEEGDWYKQNILNKPDTIEKKEGVLYSEPYYEDNDLLDIYVYKNLIESADTKEDVEQIRQARKNLINNLHSESIGELDAYIRRKELDKFTTGSKVQDIEIKVLNSVNNAYLRIMDNTLSASLTIGMVWNQPSLEKVRERIEEANLTQPEISGKFAEVAGLITEASIESIYNMFVGAPMIFANEYALAKKESQDAGESKLRQEMTAVPIATINTLIELAQIGTIFKLSGAGKGAQEAIKNLVRKGAVGAFIKSGGRFTWQAISAAINEGVEGTLQESTGILVPAIISGRYPKDTNGNTDWITIIGRMRNAFVGESIGSLGLGLTGAAYNARKVQQYKYDMAGGLMVFEGLPEKQAFEVASTIVERVVSQEGTPKEIYIEEINKVKPATKQHKAVAHMISKGKEMSDSQYRRILVETTGKDTFTDMTYEEGEKAIEALKKAEVEKVEGEEVPEQGDIVEEVKQIMEEDTVSQPTESVTQTEPTTTNVTQAPTPAVEPQTMAEGEVGTTLLTKEEYEQSLGDLVTADKLSPELQQKALEVHNKTIENPETLESFIQKTKDMNIKFDNKTGIIEEDVLDYDNYIKQSQPTPPVEVQPEKVKQSVKKVSATNKSVRDLPQQAIIDGDTITIKSKVGKHKAGEYQISLAEWQNTEREPNPNYAKAELIRSKTLEYDEQEGGIGQAQRIRDAQIRAINSAIEKTQPESAPKKSQRRQGGFLNLTPFGNKAKLQSKLNELLNSVEIPKTKKPILSSDDKAKRLKDLKRTNKVESFKNIGETIVQDIDRAFGVMSTRLKNISPKLFQEVRNKYINSSKIIVAARTLKAHPFVDGLNSKLSESDRYDFEIAQWQSDEELLQKILDKYDLQDSYNQYRDMLDLIYHEAKAVGMDIGYESTYFPSQIKDLNGLLKELGRREEYAPIVRKFEEAQANKGRKLNQDEQLQIINTLLRGYTSQNINLSDPGFARARSLIRDDISLMKYYHGFEESTSRYIESMTENIQARKFFGKTTKELTKLRGDVSRVMTTIAKLQNDTTQDNTDKITKAQEKLDKLQKELQEKDDGILEESVGSYVLDLIKDGTIKYDQQVELKQILSGIFQKTNIRPWIQTLRSFEYVGSLAQISSLITQYSEIILSLWKAPSTTLPSFIRANLRKSNITLKELGVAHVGQEWVDADFNAKMSTLMTWFQKVDAVGKETFVNSIIDKYRKLAITNPEAVKKELSKYYQEEAFDSIIESLKSGQIDNNIKGFALNELADVQPISQMEVPELYAKAGNYRVFYMYKTFTLKRLDILRNEAYNTIKSGIKSGDNKLVAKGLARLVWLALMFALADSSADMVKDVLRGKPLDDIPNYVVDNLLQMILLSKYSASRSKREGLDAFFKDNITLPISNLNAAYKDLGTLMDEDSEKGSELARRVPWVGELYYWWFGEGSRKIDEGYYDN